MRLRLQLAAFAVLTLVLPWAGWRYVLEMEQALRRGLEQSLVASAGTVAAAIDDELAELGARPAPSSSGPVYAQRLTRAPAVDARDDWSSSTGSAVTLEGGHRFRVGVHETNVFVFVEAADRDIVYQGQPGEMPYGDRVLLSLTAVDEPRRWLLLISRAPGSFRAQRTEPPAFAPGGRFAERVLGAWRETQSGFAVEARLPLEAARAGLGVAVIDVDRAGAGHTVTTSTSWREPRATPGPLVFESAALRERLAQFTRPGERFRVVDSDGFVRADIGGLDAAPALDEAPASLPESLIRLVLRGDDPEYRGLESRPRPGTGARRRKAPSSRPPCRFVPRARSSAPSCSSARARPC